MIGLRYFIQQLLGIVRKVCSSAFTDTVREALPSVPKFCQIGLGDNLLLRIFSLEGFQLTFTRMFVFASTPILVDKEVFDGV